MEIKMSLITDWDESDGKSMTDQHPNVEISFRVSSDKFPNNQEMNVMLDKFCAAIGTKTKTRELGGNA
jgi:hypothetical protein